MLAFSDILIRSCRGRELVFLTQEGAFLIIGSQLPPVSRPEQIRTKITEQFQRSDMQTHHLYLRQHQCQMRVAPSGHTAHTAHHRRRQQIKFTVTADEAPQTSAMIGGYLGIRT